MESSESDFGDGGGVDEETSDEERDDADWYELRKRYHQRITEDFGKNNRWDGEHAQCKRGYRRDHESIEVMALEEAASAALEGEAPPAEAEPPAAAAGGTSCASATGAGGVIDQLLYKFLSWFKMLIGRGPLLGSVPGATQTVTFAGS